MLKKFYLKGVTEAGCDEAGRGCMAGPVTAAAVILHPEKMIPGLNDSKKLSEKKRAELAEIIKINALDYAVAMVEPKIIDEINILNASILAMHNALSALSEKFTNIIVDGNRFKQFSDIPHTCIIKGDAKYQSIAAASILAKTERDKFMLQLHNDFPQYSWDRNKGYATKAHIQAMNDTGLSIHHRKSFHLHKQMKIQFPK